MTSSNGSIFRVTGPLCGEFTGESWVNNRDAGGVRRHRAHYDVTVMSKYYLQNVGDVVEAPINIISQTLILPTNSERKITLQYHYNNLVATTHRSCSKHVHSNLCKIREFYFIDPIWYLRHFLYHSFWLRRYPPHVHHFLKLQLCSINHEHTTHARSKLITYQYIRSFQERTEISGS